MKKRSFLLLGALCSLPALAQTADAPSAWRLYANPSPFDRALVFDTRDEGEKLPILWGFDTAWNDYANMLRGIRHVGADYIGVARVSFQPWAIISEKGVLPPVLQQNLEERLKNVALVGKKVDIALNLDGGSNTVKGAYGGLNKDNEYVGDKDVNADNYALLIDATAAAVEKAGYKVVSAAPFNEPDYFWNGTPIDVFAKINERLKDFDKFPRFKEIRISGGNTLNCDEALPWYEELKDNLDEGNTHQLAGDFDHYADFFATVRADGKWATADELHNVMEAMVGVEYGMQTGIWWGSAEQARGEFCKASFGERLGYAENRKAWSAASVYRSPDGKIRGFLGCSERQAWPSSFNIVSRRGDVFVDGFGPVREYVVNLPGDPKGAYQTDLQRNAETMVNISYGEDPQPYIVGDYMLVNGATKLVIGGKDGNVANGTDLVLQSPNGGEHQTWSLSRVPENQGGDFSYWFIKNGNQSFDDYDWHLEPGSAVRTYGHSGSGVQQWTLEYDGDGWFHIRNKQSALYLEANTAGAQIVQNERTDNLSQKWRFVAAGNPVEFDAPAAPEGLKATPLSASVMLEWTPSADTDNITYNVLRRAAGETDYNTIARGLTATSMLDNTVEGKTEYSYKVMACDGSGNRSECSAAIEAAATQPGGILASYPLDGSLDDLCENAFTAKAAATPAFRKGHKEDVQALSCRGDQYLQLPYSVMQADAFTVSFWTALTSIEDRKIFSTGVSPEETLYLAPYEGGQLKLVARNGENEAEIATTVLPQREWHHLAFTFDGQTATLYVDGEAAGNADFSTAIPADRLLTYIGRATEGGSALMQGMMADVRIYGSSLPAEKIGNLMNSAPAAVDGIESDKSVVETQYFNLQGVRVDGPDANSVTVRKVIFSDGTSVTFKTAK